MKTITWHAAGLTDKGLVRAHNEDNFSISSDTRVFVVADGMGGTKNGALASKLAVAELEDYRQTKGLDLSQAESMKEFLVESIARANKRVIQEQEVTKAQMGTTIVAAVQSDDGILHIAHVGDSRAYLVREGETNILTSDHSVVMEMFKSGQLTKSQVKESPFRHLITRCLGHEREVECDYMAVDVQKGDWIILASDGLSAVIDEQQLAEIVPLAKDPAEACEDLVKKTIAGGAPDNVTVLVLHYQEEGGSNGKAAGSLSAATQTAE